MRRMGLVLQRHCQVSEGIAPPMQRSSVRRGDDDHRFRLSTSAEVLDREVNESRPAHQKHQSGQQIAQERRWLFLVAMVIPVVEANEHEAVVPRSSLNL